ncbi:lamin tail domain-containing protein [candidate division KSB1 bacterium]|nr:lamin tail domain-containing protein [candidate division KSB1 bacterium]
MRLSARINARGNLRDIFPVLYRLAACLVQFKRILLGIFLLCVVSQTHAQTSVFINEIHYDNSGTDTGEAIEVAGPAGIDLTGWSLVLYNGAGGAVYDTDALSGIIPNQCNGFGTIVLSYPSNGLQNGAPDGIALVNPSNVAVQFISYEGSFTAVGGAANGMTSLDIGVLEGGGDASGNSLQLSGTGQFYEDFTWNAPAANTFSACNTGQTFLGIDTAPFVSSTTPADNATNVNLDANLIINFNEAVNVTGNWFAISGSSSTTYTATVSGGPQSFTIDPSPDFQNNETVTITIFAANVTDADADDPPDNMTGNHVFGFTTVAAPAGGWVINEIHADPHATLGDANGDGVVNTTQDEFVEIVNVSGAAVDISGWTLSDAVGMRHTFPSGTMVDEQCCVVIFAGGTPTGAFGAGLVQVASGGQLGLNNTGDTVTLKNGSTTIVAYTYGSEGGNDQSLTRDPDITGADPLIQHLSATGAAGRRFSPGTRIDGSQFSGCAVIDFTKEIFEIQGAGLTSAFAGQSVTTEDNVVTALRSDGFFIQTPDVRSDGDTQTSDGIFVFMGSTPTVSVGDLVKVTGTVAEFFNFTQFTNTPSAPVVTISSSGNALPTAIQLDALTPSPMQPQSATEYERFEGMLVGIANGVVAASNQSFSGDDFAEMFIVASGARPFREPGIAFPGMSGLPVWDANAEIFEIDPDRLGLANAIIPAGSTFTAAGVLAFEFGDYELWPTQYEFNAATLPRSVRPRNTGETMMVTLNLHRLFDDVNDGLGEPVPPPAQYADILNKFSRYIREVLLAPEILAVQEVENLNALQDLADKLHADDAAISYTPYLFEGNDVSGIDVGYLVRSAVQVHAVTQLGANEIFTFDNTLLHDRPPLQLEATLPGGIPVTVLNLHQRSLNDIDDPSSGPRVRQKRHEQAVSVANMVQGLQTGNANINLIVCGDFNAFQFTDGYVDVLGQILGDPADASEALIPGVEIVEPNLVNLVLGLPASERYSFIEAGNAQVLDHMLVSQHVQPAVSGVQYARGNADAAANFENDYATTLRTSDHDGLAIYVRCLVTASAGDDVEICFGDSAQIGGNPTASDGLTPYSYSWSPLAGLSDATSANPKASPASTTTYSVIVTDATGCKDTSEVTVTVNPKPLANAGADQTIVIDQTIQIGGNPTASAGTPPFTYEWSPQTGLDDHTSENPNATSEATTTYVVIVTDSKGCTDSDTVTIIVKELVLLANQSLEIRRNQFSNSTGDIHSNNSVHFKPGAPTTFTGNVTAVGDVRVDKENTIAGDVTAGGVITLAPSAQILGAATSGATVATINIAAPSFSAGGADHFIPNGRVRELAPGSYGHVIVGENAKLRLRSGDYFFETLITRLDAKVKIDVSGGPARLHVVTLLEFGRRTRVEILPPNETASRSVSITTLQSAPVVLFKGCQVRGTLRAPHAEVFLGMNTHFLGAIYADKITADRDVTFKPHASQSTLAKIAEGDDEHLATNNAPLVTDYKLEQNYPNPFNPSTTIRFAVPEASEVSLEIYNSAGQFVRRLADGRYLKGRYEAVWEGTDEHGTPVASGVYLCVFRAGKFTAHSKLLLMK